MLSLKKNLGYFCCSFIRDEEVVHVVYYILHMLLFFKKNMEFIFETINKHMDTLKCFS